MGRLKDWAIEMGYLRSEDCDDHEMQPHPNVELKLAPTPAYVLMHNTTPVAVYQRSEAADYDCWLCNEGEKFSPDPHPYWVKPVGQYIP